jgi:hypothetical protein
MQLSAKTFDSKNANLFSIIVSPDLLHQTLPSHESQSINLFPFVTINVGMHRLLYRLVLYYTVLYCMYRLCNVPSIATARLSVRHERPLCPNADI